MKNIFKSRTGIIIAGSVIGIIAALLQYMGNPPNMGFCIACFERDIAGAIGLHRADVVQYVRPEIIGIMIGALLISMIKGEFRPRGGSSTVIRFFLGAFAMVGALVFLGCPWRAFIRLAGGDWNAVLGILGLIVGIGIGSFFIKKGYSLGRNYSQSKAVGFIMPAFMIVLFLMLVFGFSKLMLSEKGPGSMHASIIISIIAGLIVGGLAQRSRFCTMGSIRDIILVKDFHLISGVAAFTLAVFIMNLILGQFHPGFTLSVTDAAGVITSKPQAIAHSMHLWNFLGMVLAGLAFSLAGGCPGRQLILTGEGDTDSGIFVLGMIAGAAFSHNFAMASSGKGIGTFGAWGTIIGLVFCLIIAYTMTQKRKLS
ncbi:MAG: YedE-related selenium metabolism membrane protein [Candidatus Delongbacteria bacterium]|nr:YedE-related selenium metabolism membrane protein [Candidatus Delongbacteria bacterium]MCG2761521.1 YedE-related selenium metabolism membrane protein [Candidatus Delongbacteria bacterium]